MPILDVQNLSKRLGERVLLDSVNLTLRRGEHVGLVGENGSGKSTLAKILAGVAEADSGAIHRRRDQTIGYLAQAPDVVAGETPLEHVRKGRSNWYQAHRELLEATELLSSGQADAARVTRASEVFEHEGGYARDAEAVRLLRALGINEVEAHLEVMSGGEQRRVALARVLFAEPDLAIFDEPTNHLDAETIEWFEEYLSESFRGAFLLITHDRFLLNRVVDRTLEVDRGRLFSYEGGWEEYLLGRGARDEMEAKVEANRQNFLRREIEWLRRQPKARTGKQKARVSRGEAALEVKAPKARLELDLKVEEAELGAQVLEARKLSVRFGERTVLKELDLRLDRGMRLGIVGPSGSGKTTLLKALLGDLTPSGGEVTRGPSVKVAYLDQMKGSLNPDETVYEAVLGQRQSVEIGKRTLGGYSYLGRFGFDSRASRQKVSALSGGERARLSLARLLLEPANLLVLDEPTNDLDVMTLGTLEDLLLELSGSLLLVSHDRYFLDRVSTHTLAYENPGSFRLWVGGFSYYWERKRELEKAPPERAPAAAALEKPRPPEGFKKLTYAEEKELSQLLPKVEAAGLVVEGLEQKLADPTLYVERRDEAALLRERLEQAKAELAALEERWLVLEERRQMQPS